MYAKSQRRLLSGTAQHGLGDPRALSMANTREVPSLTIDLGILTVKYGNAPASGPLGCRHNHTMAEV